MLKNQKFNYKNPEKNPFFLTKKTGKKLSEGTGFKGNTLSFAKPSAMQIEKYFIQNFKVVQLIKSFLLQKS